ncbi:GAF domain-containing protein [Halorubrum sp. JWXQ-INN 858]|uniref:receiver/sensor box histidine kinase n=1 Tax=Halorubrum sp. JWXQ-INN 858 TaxID=2690782 RepID=UPI00135C484E|nr:GAF domain-containing protein [Halorubrum sp. JWXQ-INN 858]MWV65537.1 GAF domain-containing protein [Halorubrum sp. JWXQ-INN 858]
MNRPIRVLCVDGDPATADRVASGIGGHTVRRSSSGRMGVDRGPDGGSDPDVDGGSDPDVDSDPGVDVVAAGSTEEAISIVDARPIDCVVSDHDPPEIDALRLLELVRARDPEVPLFVFPRTGSERLAGEATRHAAQYVPRTGEDDACLENESLGDGRLGDEYFDLGARVRTAIEDVRETLFDRLPIGAVEWDGSLGVARANREAEAILGYEESALRGEPWATIAADGDRDGLGTTCGVERNVTAGGETIACEWHHRTVTDDGGSIESVVSTFRDVTDRIERERRVSELRNRLRDLSFTTNVAETVRIAVDAAEDVMRAPLSGVHLLDDDGETIAPVLLVDQAHEAFGTPPAYERSAPPGSRAGFVWDVFERGEPGRLADVAADDRIRETTPAGSVIVYPLGDHGVFIVSAREPNAFTDTDDALAEILARTLTTALNRVEREKRRQERERRLGRLHEATRELIASDTQAEVADCAVAAAEDILGFSITLVRLYDADVGGLVPVADSDAVSDRLPDREAFGPDGGSLNWRAYDAGEVMVFDDIECVDAIDAGTGLRSLMILPLGEYGTLSVGELEPNAFDETDVSLARILATTVETVLEANDRKAAIRRQRDELEAQNARLERFADVLSHDLRSPLTVAQGRLELARETSPAAAEHHDAIARAHGRMGALIDDLLTLARDGEEVTETESVALGALLERCWDTVETGAAELRIRTERTVVADPNRLRQLFENLIRNAVEHGGEGITLTVGDLSDGDGFYVADDGPGIPSAERSKVFEFGYTTTRGGTGFGLSIVMRIAEAHGWSVTATESVDGGTRFEFRTDGS